MANQPFQTPQAPQVPQEPREQKPFKPLKEFRPWQQPQAGSVEWEIVAVTPFITAMEHQGNEYIVKVNHVSGNLPSGGGVVNYGDETFGGPVNGQTTLGAEILFTVPNGETYTLLAQLADTSEPPNQMLPGPAAQMEFTGNP